MSGNFRKALGPIHGRIKTYIKKYKEIAPVGFDASKLTPEGKAKTATAIKRLCKKLAKAISDAEKYLEKWVHLISTSSAEESQIEIKAREKFFQDYGSIPDTLKLAEEVLDDGENLLETLGASVTTSSESDQLSTTSNSVILDSVNVLVSASSPATPTATVFPAGQLQVTTSLSLTTTTPTLPTTTTTMTTSVASVPVVAKTISTTSSTVIHSQPPPSSNLNVFYPVSTPAYKTPAANIPQPALQNVTAASTTIDPYPLLPQPVTPHTVVPLTTGFPTTNYYTTPTATFTPPPGYVTPASLKAMVANFHNFQPLTQAELALLPHVKLDTFDGDLLKFFAWWQLFFSIIHSKSLDNVVKFQILKNHLCGPAADLISGFEITGQNYITAINTLLDTYGSSSPSRHSLRTQIFRIPPISGTRRPEDISSCRTIIKLYRQLVNHGDPCDNEWAGQIIEQKLPRSTLSELYKEFPEDTPLDAPKILDKLKELLNMNNESKTLTEKTGLMNMFEEQRLIH
uniref:Uncharacterized protein n=1 Tax=Panagrolaimus sp. ES5 TaxID=591445 RepID=A0AC34FMX7_9BILA